MPTPNLKTERKTGNPLKSPLRVRKRTAASISEIFRQIGDA
jgi:hypothetical protein